MSKKLRKTIIWYERHERVRSVDEFIRALQYMDPDSYLELKQEIFENYEDVMLILQFSIDMTDRIEREISYGYLRPDVAREVEA